jgi:hypothetical protein
MWKSGRRESISWEFGSQEAVKPIQSAAPFGFMASELNPDRFPFS